MPPTPGASRSPFGIRSVPGQRNTGPVIPTPYGTSVLLALVAVVVFGLWLRYPMIGNGMPYIYDVDEGHHYNRLVEMVKEGELNPRYFRKPSLHFYLRMPAVAGGFLWSATEGELESIEDIVTRDPFGRGGWARAASHPSIVMWTRSVTTVLSLLIIVVTYLLAAHLVQSRWMGVGAALLVASSPGLIRDSGKIGVDTLMALTCLLTIYLAVRAVREPRLSYIVATGLCAGLAVSSKYNALPIALLPLGAYVLSTRWTAWGAAAALMTPMLGFLAGTPFALVEIPRVLDGIADGILHYERGHGFATGEPGVPQAMFYLRWIAGSATGTLVTAFGMLGALVVLWMHRGTGALVLLFPLLYGLLMVNQRVNFTRNMLVMIPVVCILAMVTVDRLLSWLAARQWPPGAASMALTPAFVLLVAFTPIARSLDFHERISSRPPDSRIDVSRWLAGASRAYSDTAISGELQFPLQEYLARGVTRFAADEMDTVVLFLAGFDRLVVGPEFDSARPDLLLVEQVFPGDQTARPTIPVNPEVRVYRLPHVLIESTAVRSLVEEQPRYAVAPPTYVQGEPDTPDEWTCAPVSESEEWVEPSIEHCWVQSRLARVILDPRAIEVAVGRSRDVGVTLACTAPGFLDSGLTVFASTPPRPARGGRVAPGPGFGSRTSPASTARCTSA